ncbi:MAG TPA: hypothetical protein VLS89_12790 [Candidatus Nanopelagicales bacterium]|nr:hypothetical protein [Candidatus Nanopelagicales bacterium]
MHGFMPSRRPGRSAVPCSAGAILLAACVAGCAGTLPDDDAGGDGKTRGVSGGGDAASPPAGSPATPESAREAYRAVDPLLLKSCSGCHAGTNEDNFLEPALEDDRYLRMKQWPSFITPDPANSVLLTYPRENGSHPGQSNQNHLGTSVDDVSGLRDALTGWLTEEARLIVQDTESPLGAGTDPFTPIVNQGLNAVYLDLVDPALAGAAIVFLAEEAAFGLTLSDLRVHASHLTGLTIERPRIVVYPLGIEASTAALNDDFSNVKLDIPNSGVAPLGAGLVFLTEWTPGAKIAFHFETIKPYSASGPVGNPCRELGVFEAEVRPQFAACYGCHAIAANEAHLAMNLVGLADGSAVADTCAQILNRVVDLDNPASSLVFLNSAPGGPAVHQFEFSDASTFNVFKSEVTIWIDAERVAAMSAGQ